jgi:hypothetical protein
MSAFDLPGSGPGRLWPARRPETLTRALSHRVKPEQEAGYRLRVMVCDIYFAVGDSEDDVLEDIVRITNYHDNDVLKLRSLQPSEDFDANAA